MAGRCQHAAIPLATIPYLQDPELTAILTQAKKRPATEKLALLTTAPREDTSMAHKKVVVYSHER